MAENKVDPKEIEKVQKLLSDEEFVKKLISQETIEDAKKLFEDQGIATSIEEMEMLGRFIKKISQKGNEKLSEEDLEEIVGGGKLKNGFIRAGGIVTGAATGALCGALSNGIIGAGIGGGATAIAKRHSSDSSANPEHKTYAKMEIVAATIGSAILPAITGSIVGAIGGAVAGYKISGKWCDK